MTSQESQTTSQESGKFISELRRGLETRAGKMGASFAIAVGALTLSACGGEETPRDTPTAAETVAPADNPETEAPAETFENNMGPYENDPTVTEADAEQRLTELQFTADMTPVELAAQYVETANRWNFAGATPESFLEFYTTTDKTIEEISVDIASRNTDLYATALFGEDYASVADMPVREMTPHMEEFNAKSIERFIMTYGEYDNPEIPEPSPTNVEAFHSEGVLLGEPEVPFEAPGEITIAFEQEFVTNSDKNKFGEIGDTLNGTLNKTQLTFMPSATDPNIMIITGISINELN